MSSGNKEIAFVKTNIYFIIESAVHVRSGIAKRQQASDDLNPIPNFEEITDLTLFKCCIKLSLTSVNEDL